MFLKKESLNILQRWLKTNNFKKESIYLNRLIKSASIKDHIKNYLVDNILTEEESENLGLLNSISDNLYRKDKDQYQEVQGEFLSALIEKNLEGISSLDGVKKYLKTSSTSGKKESLVKVLKSENPNLSSDIDIIHKKNYPIDYYRWIISILKNEESDPLSEILFVVDLYLSNKSKLPSDITSFPFLSDIRNYMDSQLFLDKEYYYEKIKTHALSEKYSDIIYESDNFIVVLPGTTQSSQWWGRGTNWCTAYISGNKFAEYAKNNVYLYYVITKESSKYFKKESPSRKMSLGYVKEGSENVLLSDEHGAVVNANNVGIKINYIRDNLKDEADAILSAIDKDLNKRESTKLNEIANNISYEDFLIAVKENQTDEGVLSLINAISPLPNYKSDIFKKSYSEILPDILFKNGGSKLIESGFRHGDSVDHIMTYLDKDKIDRYRRISSKYFFHSALSYLLNINSYNYYDPLPNSNNEKIVKNARYIKSILNEIDKDLKGYVSDMTVDQKSEFIAEFKRQTYPDYSGDNSKIIPIAKETIDEAIEFGINYQIPRIISSIKYTASNDQIDSLISGIPRDIRRQALLSILSKESFWFDSPGYNSFSDDFLGKVFADLRLDEISSVASELTGHHRYISLFRILHVVYSYNGNSDYFLRVCNYIDESIIKHSFIPVHGAYDSSTLHGSMRYIEGHLSERVLSKAYNSMGTQDERILFLENISESLRGARELGWEISDDLLSSVHSAHWKMSADRDSDKINTIRSLFYKKRLSGEEEYKNLFDTVLDVFWEMRNESWDGSAVEGQYKAYKELKRLMKKESLSQRMLSGPDENHYFFDNVVYNIDYEGIYAHHIKRYMLEGRYKYILSFFNAIKNRRFIAIDKYDIDYAQAMELFIDNYNFDTVKRLITIGMKEFGADLYWNLPLLKKVLKLLINRFSPEEAVEIIDHLHDSFSEQYAGNYNYRHQLYWIERVVK